MLIFRYFLISLFAYSSLSGQSLTGISGNFKVPSAYVPSDGTISLGASFLPKGSYNLYNTSDLYNGLPTFVSLSLFNRLELMFRYTHQLGQTIDLETKYFPDRMFAIKAELVKENHLLPSITIGLHDFSEAFGGSTGSPWFLSTYLVSSKTYRFKGFTFSPSLGYGFNLFSNYQNQVFNGFFTGILLSPKGIPWLTAIMEYDTIDFNFAIKTTVLKHLDFSIGHLGTSGFSGFLSYRFNLNYY